MTDVPEPQWERTAKTKMGTYLTSIETAFIKKTVDFTKIRLIADVGCGGGKYTRIAMQNNAEVISLDRDLNSLKWLKQTSPNANPVLSDAASLPLRENFFDGMFLIEIFDYIPQTQMLLQECKRVLKQDGTFIFSFGNTNSLKSRLKQLRGSRYMQDRRSYKEVTQMLKTLNFEITQKTGYNWMLMDRQSNNPLIPLLGKLIRLFRLQKLPAYSPWIIAAASKQA